MSDRLLLYYNGLVLRDYDTKYPSVRTSKQLEAATILEEAISKCGFGSVRLKSRGAFTDPRAFLERGWSAAPAFSYVVSIEDTKKQWERVEQNLRRLVDRCSDQGMVFSDGEDFDSFFELHARTSARKTAPSICRRSDFGGTSPRSKPRISAASSRRGRPTGGSRRRSSFCWDLTRSPIR